MFPRTRHKSEPYLQDKDKIKSYLSVHMDVICEPYVQDKPHELLPFCPCARYQ